MTTTPASLQKVLAPLRESYDAFEKEREKLITASRALLKLSKGAIYALQRGDTTAATEQLTFARNGVKEIRALIKTTPLLITVGAYDEGLQEYVEAELFAAYCLNESLPQAKHLGVDAETYLLGLCDMTGELARLAVNSVIKDQPHQALAMKTWIELVYQELQRFDFRNSQLRSKFDRLRGTLERLEDMALKLKLR